MSRPKGSKNKTSNKSKTSNIINKFNARLKSISNEFGKSFLRKEVIDNLKTDPNIILTKGLTISSKSTLNQDTLDYLNSVIPTSKDIMNKYRNGEDARIDEALKGVTDLKEIKKIIGKQVSSMYNVQDTFVSARDSYYEAKDIIDNVDLSQEHLIDPIKPDKINDPQIKDAYNALIQQERDLLKLKNDINGRLYAKGIKTYEYLDELQEDILDFKQQYEDYNINVEAYNNAVSSMLTD